MTNITRPSARDCARLILTIVPLVMRTVAAELRAAGELPAPAHFGLLSLVAGRPRMLSELAAMQGVSLPTMSKSVHAMVERGWVRRATPARDRRVVIIEVTPAGRSMLDRVGRSAERRLAERLAPLTPAAQRRLRGGLAVLHLVFEGAPRAGARAVGRPGPARARTLPRREPVARASRI